MFDLLMLGLGATVFAACAGYVAWCDRIIGPDPQTAATNDATVHPEIHSENPRHGYASGVTGDRMPKAEAVSL